MTITITKNHLENMKKKLNERMYRIQKTFRAEQEYNMACWEESEYLNSISENDIVCELDRTYRLCDDIDWYIENLRDDEIEVNSDAWFEEWDFKSTVDDNQFDEYYMLSIEQTENIRRNKMKYNKTIRIYRSDIEKMKSQIKRRMSKIWGIYYSESQWDEEYAYAATSSNEVWREICRTHFLCDKADALLADESFDFIYVDADEWFEEWHFEELIEKGLIDEYYMLPDSGEIDEIFESMRANYKYTIEDLFGFYRFYPIDENVVVA